MLTESHQPQPGRSRVSPWLLVVVCAVAYALLAEVGHALSFPGNFATFWLPAGFFVTALTYVEPKRWKFVFVGTLIANVSSDVFLHQKPLPVACGFWIANAVEAIAATLLLRARSHPFRLAEIRDVVWFLVGPCLLATAAGATIGAGVVAVAFDAPWLQTWQIWWSGDVIGMAVVFPFLWSLCELKQLPREQVTKTLPTIGGWLLLITLLAIQMLVADYIFGRQHQRLAYVSYPFLLLLVVRFPRLGGTSGLVATAVITVLHTAAGNGLLGGIEDIPERAVVLQIFLMVTTTTTLTLGATVRQNLDTTARHRQTLRELRKTTSELDQLFELLPMALVLADADRKIVRTNSEFEKHFGYESHDVVGQSVRLLYKDPEEFLRQGQNRFRAGAQASSDPYEVEYCRRDGTVFHGATVGRAMTDSDGELIANIGLIQDVSERRQNERMVQSLFDASPVANVMIDRQGVITLVNPAAERLFGYETGSLVGQSVEILLPEEFRDSHPALREAFFTDPANRRMAPGRSVAGRHQDGSELFLEVGLSGITIDKNAYALAAMTDITERTRREKQLQELQQKLELTVEGGNVGLWDWSITTGVAHFSDQWHLQLGEVPGTLSQADDWQQRLHPDDLQRVTSTVESAIQGTGDDYEATFRLRHTDGSYRSILARGRIYRDDGGHAERMLGTHTDVTELERARVVSQESEQRFRNIADSTPVSIWVCDETGACTWLNACWLQFAGMTLEESTNDGWLDVVHPEDRDSTAEIYQSAFQARKSFTLSYRLKRHDGVYRWHSAIASPRTNASDTFLGYVGMSVDDHDARAIRERLEAYLHLLGTTDGGWNWDLATDHVEYAPRFRELIGFDGDDLDGFPETLKSFDERVHPDDKDEVWTRVQRHLQEEVPYQAEFRLRLRDGTYRWFRGRGDTIRDGAGKPLRMAGSIYDITEHKEAEFLLLQSLGDLEQFAYVASHDLQEPLRAIDGYCQLLEQRYSNRLDDRGRGYLRHAVEGASRLQNLIADLLNFTKVSRTGIKAERVSLDDCVAEAQWMLSNAIDRSGAQFESSDLPTVTGHHSLLVLLFQNLFSNAIKFCKSSTDPHIRVSAQQDGANWRIDVSDNGIGIPAEYQEQIFALFKRLHRREQIPGTGLGLAICRRIVDRHDGSIRVHSTVGEGATFSISLPVNSAGSV